MTAPPLAVRDVTVDYGGLRAVDQVSLTVDHGQTVALIGPNGAGKTTMFDAVCGITEPTNGHVLLYGEDVAGLAPHRRARLGLGRTFQRLELFGSLTVVENLIVATESNEGVGGLASELLRRPASIDVRRRAEAAANELLSLVGLYDEAETRTGDLPMGSARMLELARALATRPRLLLLDEPSSGLNEEETQAFAQLLRSVKEARDLSLLIVEHDVDLVLGLSDHVYVLDFGRVIAAGDPDGIRDDPAVRAAYLGHDVRTG